MLPRIRNLKNLLTLSYILKTHLKIQLTQVFHHNALVLLIKNLVSLITANNFNHHLEVNRKKN